LLQRWLCAVLLAQLLKSLYAAQGIALLFLHGLFFVGSKLEAASEAVW
jgi:hypothetical protein